jgi:hypothetical protein
MPKKNQQFKYLLIVSLLYLKCLIQIQLQSKKISILQEILQVPFIKLL